MKDKILIELALEESKGVKLSECIDTLFNVFGDFEIKNVFSDKYNYSICFSVRDIGEITFSFSRIVDNENIIEVVLFSATKKKRKKDVRLTHSHRIPFDSHIDKNIASLKYWFDEVKNKFFEN